VLTAGIRAIANSRERMQALRNFDTRLAALLAARGASGLLKNAPSDSLEKCSKRPRPN